MKFTAVKNDVLNAVKNVGGIVGKGVITVLANILFKTDKERNSVTVEGTNIELRLECSFEAKIEEDGITTIPGRKLISVLSAMTGSDVVFDTNDLHHTTIKSGKAKVKLNGMNSDEFPILEEFTAKCMLSLSMEQMQSLVKDGTYYVSADNTRKVLCGIFAEFEKDQCHFVSTNGKALAHAGCTLTSKVIAEDKSFCIIPAAALNLLISNSKANSVSIGFSDKKIALFAGDFAVYAKLIEGNYPNYKNFTGMKYSNAAVLPVAETIAKLSLLNAVVSQDNPSVDITISGNNIKLSSESASSGSVDDEMELFEGTDKEYTFSLNPALMMAAFAAHKQEEKVTLNFNDETSPVEFKFKNSIAVIMPIRKKQA